MHKNYNAYKVVNRFAGPLSVGQSLEQTLLMATLERADLDE